MQLSKKIFTLKTNEVRYWVKKSYTFDKKMVFIC